MEQFNEYGRKGFGRGKNAHAGEQRQVHTLLNSLLENQAHPQTTEDDFLQLLLQKGIITNIPNTADDVDEDDEFEPVVVQGKPLSETVIEERR